MIADKKDEPRATQMPNLRRFGREMLLASCDS